MVRLLKDYAFDTDGFEYVNYWKGIERRDEIAEQIEKLEKALSLAGTGSNLVPVYVDPQIVDLTRKATPLVELIPRVANRGKSTDFNQITSLGDVGWKPEDAALADQSDTYKRRTALIRFLYTVGRVTGPMMAASAEYVDAMSQEVLMKTKQIRYYEEDTLLNGATSNSSVPFNSQAYDGLLVQQAPASTTSTNPYVSADGDFNGLNKSAGALTVDDIRTQITAARNNGGEPKLLITDWGSVDKLRALLMDFQRYLDTTRLAWGIETLSFDGIPVLGSRFLASAGLPSSWVTSGSYQVPSGLTGPVMLLLDTDVVEMRVLQDIVMEKLAKVNDSDKFYLKLYESVVNKAPQFSAFIQNYI
jgi:hypothetical protein